MSENEQGSNEAESIRAKYLAERDKRLVPGRADIRDLASDPVFARYRADPFSPYEPRAPIHDEVDVVIVGGGIAGRARRREPSTPTVSNGSGSSTRPAASAEPGTGTGTRA